VRAPRLPTEFAHKQPPVGGAADDCSARRKVAALTIELATEDASDGADADECFATTKGLAGCAAVG